MRSRFVTVLAALAITLLAGVPATAAGSETGISGVFTIGPGHTFIADVPGASTTLVRTPNGISVSVQTSGLLAGHAVTVWALIFNDPSQCLAGCEEMAGDLNVPGVQGAVFHVTGHVVSGNTDSFGGRVNVGDAANSVRGPGLLDPYGARIHLIIRDHGVAATGELLQQQFNDISPRFCNVSCFDAQKSVHAPHQ
jgi:hypothetical protein